MDTYAWLGQWEPPWYLGKHERTLTMRRSKRYARGYVGPTKPVNDIRPVKAEYSRSPQVLLRMGMEQMSLGKRFTVWLRKKR